MAMCPLLREECRREQCAWWFEAEPEEDSNCVIVLLAERIDDIRQDVDIIETDISAGVTVYT